MNMYVHIPPKHDLCMLVNKGAFAVKLTFHAFEEVTYSLQSFMQCCICQPIRLYDIL